MEGARRPTEETVVAAGANGDLVFVSENHSAVAMITNVDAVMAAHCNPNSVTGARDEAFPAISRRMRSRSKTMKCSSVRTALSLFKKSF
ncbi:MAG TPA: hypothetical protein VGB38_08205 [bacterium]